MYKVNKTIYLQIINRVFVFQLNCFVVQFLVFPAYYGNFSIHVSGNYPFQYFLPLGIPSPPPIISIIRESISKPSFLRILIFLKSLTFWENLLSRTKGNTCKLFLSIPCLLY